MDKDKLTVDSIRGYRLFVYKGNTKLNLPCVSVTTVMAINTMHKCSVFVAIGRSISNADSTVEGTDVYTKLFDYKEPVACAIVEYTGVNEVDGKKTGRQNEKEDDGLIIFKGYIMSVALDYKSSTTSSSIRVKVDCLGAACKLVAHPTNLYTEISTSVLLQKITRELVERPTTPSSNGEPASQYTFAMSKQTVFNNARTRFLNLKRFVDKIAYVVSIINLTGKPDNLTPQAIQDAPLNEDVLEALGGKLCLNDSFMKDEDGKKWSEMITCCEEKISESLFSLLSAGMTQDSVYNAILSALTSFEFGLQLVPRFRCDDEGTKDNGFKMDICMAAAVYDSPVLTLTSNAVKSITSSFESLSWMNTPDVILVSFEAAVNYLGRKSQSEQAGIFGVASYDDELNDALRDFTQKGEYGRVLDSVIEKGLKLRQLKAPSWLVYMLSPRTIEGMSVSEFPPVTVDEETSKKTDNNTSMILNKAFKAANDVAHNLLRLLYRNESKIVLDIMPTYRFGRHEGVFLENNIGNRIAIDIGSAASFGEVLSKDEKERFYFEGTLESIQYNWTTSPSAYIRYTITLKNIKFGRWTKEEERTNKNKQGVSLLYSRTAAPSSEEQTK